MNNNDNDNDNDNNNDNRNNENRNLFETFLFSLRDSLFASSLKEKDKLEKIPEFSINSTIELNKFKSKNCTICLEDFKVKDKLIYLPCFHLFHKDCIISWAKENSICPLCKIDINDNIN